MRVVLDTNVLVSALLMDSSRPAQLISHWRQGRFTLLTAAPQLEELMRVTRYPKLRARLKPALPGRLRSIQRVRGGAPSFRPPRRARCARTCSFPVWHLGQG